MEQHHDVGDVVFGLETDPTIYDVFNRPRPRPIGQRVRVTEEVFQYFLNILPPIYCPGGFLIVEDDSTLRNGRAVRSKFTEDGTGHFFHEWAVDGGAR